MSSVRNIGCAIACLVWGGAVASSKRERAGDGGRYVRERGKTPATERAVRLQRLGIDPQDRDFLWVLLEDFENNNAGLKEGLEMRLYSSWADNLRWANGGRNPDPESELGRLPIARPKYEAVLAQLR